MVSWSGTDMNVKKLSWNKCSSLYYWHVSEKEKKFCAIDTYRQCYKIFLLQSKSKTKLEHMSLLSLSTLIKYLWARLERFWVELWSGAPLLGKLLPLPTNVQQAWRCLSKGNTLTYLSVTKKKSFSKLTPGGHPDSPTHSGGRSFEYDNNNNRIKPVLISFIEILRNTYKT